MFWWNESRSGDVRAMPQELLSSPHSRRPLGHHWPHRESAPSVPRRVPRIPDCPPKVLMPRPPARPQAYHHRAMFTEPQLLIQRLAGVDERRLCAIVNISSSKGSRAGREEPGRSRSPGAIRGLRPAQKAQSDHRGQRKISKLRVFNDPEHCNSRRLHHSI